MGYRGGPAPSAWEPAAVPFHGLARLVPGGGLGVRTPGPAAPARRARRRRPRPGPRSGRTAARPSKLPPGPECGHGAGRPARAGTGDGPVDNRVRKTARKNNVQVLATPHGWDGLNGFARATNENTDIDGWLVRSDNDAYGLRTIEYAAEELLTAAQRDVEARQKLSIPDSALSGEGENDERVASHIRERNCLALPAIGRMAIDVLARAQEAVS